MKDSVTRFNFEDAFKALDEIEIPVAEKGIRANRIDLKESMKRVDKFELLFEDFYDLNNAEDMNTVSEEREAEVAKAKLARIEKIVDLDAETEDDILPSYVGKTIIQCPQCMTLFYKNAEDIVRDEENPDVVNVNEVCQHCGNESGYDVVGKVAEETEAAPGDELGTDDFSAEVGDGENDIAIDDGSETTEEAPAEEGGEVDELSAEADLDSLDLDTELDLDEEPVEEEETNESLNTSELLKKIEDKNELKTEHESEKLTLNEAMSESAFDKVIAQISADIIAEVKPTPKIEIGDYYEEASFKDVFVSWEQWDEDNYTDDPAFSDAEKAIIDWIDNNAERYPGFKLNALNDLGYNDYFITINVYTDDVQESLTEDADLNKQLNLYNDFIKYLQNMVEQDEEALERAKKQGNKEVIAAIQKRLDNSKAELEAALPETVKDEAATEELPDATEAGIEDATDNTSDETEATTESLTESITNPSEADINKLFSSEEFKKPISEKDVESFFEDVNIVDNAKVWVDYKPAFEAIAKEVDGKFDFAVNFNVYNEKIVVETNAAIQKEDLSKLLDAMTNSKVCKENNWKAVYTGLEDNKDNMIKIQFEATKSQTAKNEALADEIEEAEITVEDDTDLVTIEDGEPLTEDTIFSKSWWSKIGVYEKLLIIAQAYKCNYLSFVPLLSSKDVKPGTYIANRYPQTYIETPCYNKIKTVDIQTLVAEYQSKSSKKTAISKIKDIFNDSFNVIKPLVASGSFSAEAGKYFTTVHSDAVEAFANASIDYAWIILSRDEIKVGATDFSSAQKLGQQLLAATQNKPGIRLVGSFNKSTKDFDWDMNAIKGAGLNTMLDGAKQKLANGDTDDEEEEAAPAASDKKPDTETPTAEESEDKAAKVDEKTSEADEAPVESSSEPTTPEDRQKYLEKILATTGKKYLGVILHKDGKSFATKYVATGGTPYAKTTAFEKMLPKLPTVKYMGVPMDTAIILVDDATYEVGKVVKGKTLNETDFLAKCPAGGKVTTNLKKIADALKITFDEPDTDDDDTEITDESFKASDIDEKSFNEALTESLTTVYENVSDFTMTDCTLNGQQLMVEGVIAFASGKTKTTSYIFEARKAIEADSVTLYGTNKDLFESGEISLSTQVLNETLYAKSLSYKYTIEDKLIEGVIEK